MISTIYCLFIDRLLHWKSSYNGFYSLLNTESMRTNKNNFANVTVMSKFSWSELTREGGKTWFLQLYAYKRENKINLINPRFVKKEKLSQTWDIRNTFCSFSFFWPHPTNSIRKIIVSAEEIIKTKHFIAEDNWFSECENATYA